MKFTLNQIFTLKLIAVLCLLFSCTRDDDSIQRIDQIMNIYIKNSAGQDLLNSNKAGSFIGYSVNDQNGTSDVAPVSIPLRMTTDSLYYMEYIAGAKRVTLDSVSPENRTYRSNMVLSLRRTINNVTDTINDTMEIQYRWTPAVFQVSKVIYNGEVKFTKEADAPNSINTVTIIK
ncbi:hypothetical protein N6B72_05790 [Chryseobacterium soli]|uniref:hypothetical protein n=1 Tax=Chryseobacterium soli TaxID=445961 RepID=UPI002954BA76|nr:hypothetical protein [Chryseobacterium soli]MDV7696428.1 hypothetical protein [Chryseobacterium soli]